MFSDPWDDDFDGYGPYEGPMDLNGYDDDPSVYGDVPCDFIPDDEPSEHIEYRHIHFEADDAPF